MYANIAIELQLSEAQTSVSGAATWSGNWLDTAGARHPASAYQADQDFVSEHNLLAHLHASPPVPGFLAEAPSRPQSTSVTGAAFAGIHHLDDMVLSFIDERFGGAFTLAPAIGLAPFIADEAPAETSFVLADRTIIRLTGLARSVSRNLVGAAFAPGFAFAG